MTRVLITNDDGIDSPGLAVLAEVAGDVFTDVLVAAPSWDSSGASASLSAVEHDGRLLIEDRTDVDGMPRFAVEAAPAFIVRAALSGAFGPPPDRVLSGVNLGPNLGQAVLHSGTVGAALTAATLGVPAAALSIDVGAPVEWDTVRRVARRVVSWLDDAQDAAVLNVNVPNVSPGELAGLAPARLAAFGAVQTTVTEMGTGYVKLSYEPVDADLEPGTDAALLADGFATVTPLRAVCEHLDEAALGDLGGGWADASPGRR